MLSGPHSRDYDALFGKGMLTGHLFLVFPDIYFLCAWRRRGVFSCEALLRVVFLLREEPVRGGEGCTIWMSSRRPSRCMLFTFSLLRVLPADCEYKDVHCEATACNNVADSLPEQQIFNCQGSGLQSAFAYHNFVFVPAQLDVAAAAVPLAAAAAAVAPMGTPFVVPDALVALARPGSAPLVAAKRWQEGDGGEYGLVKGRSFAVGMVGDDYNTNLHAPYAPYPPNAQDKVFAVSMTNSLPQTNPLPALYLAPDWRARGVYGASRRRQAGAACCRL